MGELLLLLWLVVWCIAGPVFVVALWFRVKALERRTGGATVSGSKYPMTLEQDSGEHQAERK